MRTRPAVVRSRSAVIRRSTASGPDILIGFDEFLPGFVVRTPFWQPRTAREDRDPEARV